MTIQNIDSLELKNDPVKSAHLSRLRYVSDRIPGIRRSRSGNSFRYTFDDKPLKDTRQLQRISALVIPPAWTDVWICPFENGHLQVTGYDLMNRKQYRYHAQWNSFRNETKFHSLYTFGTLLPVMRKHLSKDLSLPGLPKRKVLATIVSLIEMTHIRIGSSSYEKLYGSYGLSTMKDKHVKINGTAMQFMFKGKKGVMHNITVRDKRLAKIVKQCRDIPGKELFQYYDQTHTIQSVDSGEVNEYIREISGSEFTSKDFRTWNGTLYCMLALATTEDTNGSASAVKKTINEAIDHVAKQLGNTRAVCRSHYIHPMIIDLYENEQLDSLIKACPRTRLPKELTREEQVLISLLKPKSRSPKAHKTKKPA